MQKIELTKKVIIELFVIAGLFLVLLFFAVSQKVAIGQKYQQVYFNGELVGNVANHVSVDDAVHDVRRELAAESDEPLCMDYEYSSSKANDWFTPLMTEDALKEALKEKMKVSEIETQVRAYTVAIEGYRGNFKSMDEVTEFLNTVKNEADTEGQYTTQISKEAGHISGIYTAQLTEVDPKENTEVTPEVTLADQVSAGANGAFTYQMEYAMANPRDDSYETGTIGMEFIERVEVYEKYISGDALSDVETQVEEVTKEKETNKIYVVESGDVLSVIAMDHDTTVANIMALNGFDNAEVRIYPGQEIIIAVPEPDLSLRIKKGEVYEKKLFTAKDERFKSNSFLDEVKHSYTDLINIYVQDESQKLQVFERGGVYLATKKIGKNNPKAHEIEDDNQKRQEWNRAVDMALISGVPELQIVEVKRKQITEPIKKSIARQGNRPGLFARVVTVAVEALEFLIESVLLKKSREVPEQTNVAQAGTPKAEQTESIAENIVPESVEIKEEKAEPKQPEMTRLASKFPKFFKVKKELDEQNVAIQQKQKQLSAKKKELSEVKGLFKGRKKKELQKEIDELTSHIRDMKDYLPRIVQKIGYRSVQEFLKDFKVSQTEYSEYRTAIEKWKNETGKEPESHGIRAKLAAKKQEIQNEQKNKQHTHKQNKDRGAR